MNSIYGASNKLRMTGMATGMDTDKTIKQMMSGYYARVDKVKQQQQILQWKQDSYRDFIGQINSLKSKYFDVLSKDYILSDNSFSSFKVTQTGTSNNAVSAKAVSGALEGNYTLEVISEKIAQKASLTPNKSVNIKEATGGLTFPIVIKNMDATNPNTNNNKITIDGTELTITAGNYSNLNELAAGINRDMAATGTLGDNYKAVVKDDSIKFFKKVTIDDTNNSLKIEVDGTPQNITIDKGSYTLEELASKITGKLSGGYVAKSTDGLNISFTKADGTAVDGTAKYSDDSTIGFGSKAEIVRTGADNNEFSNPKIDPASLDTLSFDKRIIAGVNDELVFNVFNGTEPSTVKIKIDPGVYDAKTLVGNINGKLGSDSTITLDTSLDGKILFKSTTGSQITVTGNAASTLGIASGFKIDQSISDKMSSIFNSTTNDRVKFTINNKTYYYDFTSTTDTTDATSGETYIGAKNKSISDIINDIQKGSNVDISYSQLDRKFYMTSKDTGSSQNITITDDAEDKFIETLFGTTAATAGTDAIVKITQPNGSGNTIIQSSNNFTVDGIQYTLNSKPTAPVTFEVQGNTDETFNKIKGFIDSYNELIGKIGDKVEERKQYKYLPLTDDEKEAMSEDQIKKWEEKAKQGMLSGDSTLGNMVSQMRKAFFDEVQGSGISLFGIGLNTSSDISQRGKIVIDEAKLKAALKDDPDKVMNLFIQKSTSNKYYSRSMSNTDRSKRYNEEGIFNRLSDIIEDNISTYRDSNGKKGTLLEIAGIKGDFTEYKNYLTDQIKDKDSKISEMLTKIYDRENRYYNQFAQLETAMSKMNAQSSWLMSQLGMSQG